MNSLDIILAIPLLVGLIFGFIRGFVTEVIKLLVVVVGVIVSYRYGNEVAIWFFEQFQWAEWICRTVAYSLLFISTAICLTLIGKVIIKLLSIIHLTLVNKLLGAGFGVIKWGLILTLLVYCTNYLNFQFGFLDRGLIEESWLYNFFLKTSDYLLTFLS